MRVGEDGRVVDVRWGMSFNENLSIGADVSDASSTPLRSNCGLSSRGYTIVGKGFLLKAERAQSIASEPRYRPIIRPYLSGGDLARTSRGLWIIDFALMSREEAQMFPVPFDIVRDLVEPERRANGREAYRKYWWRFGEPRRTLREATASLRSVICTPYQSRHRFFLALDSAIAFDDTVVVIGSASPFTLGVLSSAIHTLWALAAGGRLGAGNDPRYNNSVCFDPFPFPTPPNDLRARIAALAERLDTHRKDALARDERVTMTGMYNVVEKLRAGTSLTPKERTIHELAACGVLRDLHDELDVLVAQAYGWPWPMPREEILERLVALHDERVAEEQRGLIRWLRPEYQVPRFAPHSAASEETTPAELALEAGGGANELASHPSAVAEPPRPWPASAVEQLAAVSALVSQRAVTVDEALAAFSGAARPKVERHLETLELMGEVGRDAEGRYGVVARAS